MANGTEATGSQAFATVVSGESCLFFVLQACGASCPPSGHGALPREDTLQGRGLGGRAPATQLMVHLVPSHRPTSGYLIHALLCPPPPSSGSCHTFPVNAPLRAVYFHSAPCGVLFSAKGPTLPSSSVLQIGQVTQCDQGVASGQDSQDLAPLGKKRLLLLKDG